MRFQRSIAVVVGIDDYHSGVPPLKTPVSDAQAIAEILQAQHGYETYLVLDERAQKKHWIEWFEKKLPQLIGSRDRLLFYFAGHGIALNGENGPEGYLIPQDARLGDVNTYLSMSAVHDALDKLPCRHFIGILDCCFAGSFRWASTRDIILLEPCILHKERFDRFVQDPAWQIITSAAYDQTALDAFCLQTQRGQTGQHSPFAAALIEALQGGADTYPCAERDKPAGDGVITATELYMYLRDRVEIATETQLLRQTPGIHPMKKHDKGEFIFLTPGHELNLPPAPPLDESQNPYRGLQAFESQHSDFFFGRSELTSKLEDFVISHPLTVVQGASGAGKSSLVRAGLIPKLQKAAGKRWSILSPIRPGEYPFQTLNLALSTAHLLCIEEQSIGKTLSESIAIWAKETPNQRLFIFIDQCEEIITLCMDRTKRQAFFRQILTAIFDHRDRLRVVITLRSDFEPQVRKAGLQFTPDVLSQLGRTDLEILWQQGRFLVPMMTRAELREAVEKPAEARVMHFQPHSLTEQLIDEVADMPGALPLLSFALSELYLKYLKRQQAAKLNGTLIDRALIQSDYEALGGVIQSLTQRANQEYNTLIDQNPECKQAIRHVMLRMVTVGGGEVARRRVPLSELRYPPAKNSLTQNIVERFSAARLLISGQATDGEPYVEPAHDALVRGWDKLQTWLAQEKDLFLQRRLTPSTLEWKAQQHDKFLWHTNPYLDVLKEAVLETSNNNWLNQLETEFVQRSLQKRQSNRIRLGASIVGVLLALSGFSLFAGYQWRQAAIGQVEALLESSEANFTLNRNSFDALIDALTANKRLSGVPFMSAGEALESNVLSTLLKSVSWVREENQLLGHQNAVFSISFSPDGQLIATGSHDKTVKLWRPDGSLVKTLSGHKSKIMSVSFSPDSQMIASGCEDGRLKIWDREGTLVQDISAHADAFILDISFSANGIIATASSDKTVSVWRVADGQQLTTFKGHQNWVRYVSTSPQGDKFFTLDDSGLIKLWQQNGEEPDKTFDSDLESFISLDSVNDDQILSAVSTEGSVRYWNWDGEAIEPSAMLTSPEEIWLASISTNREITATASQTGNLSFWAQDGRLLDTWIGHYGPIVSIAFSPTGETFASTGVDGIVKLWQVHRERLTALERYPNDLFSAKFSSDGEQIAGATEEGKVRVWNKKGEWTFDTDIHESQINALSFNPHKNTLASGDNDGKIKLLSIKENSIEKIREINGHTERVMSVDFNSRGSVIASASTDGTAKLWNTLGQELVTLVDGSERILSVAFSPSEDIIATGGDDPNVKLWNRQGQRLQTLIGHTGEVWRVSFSPDGKTIATASGDQTVRLWRQSGELVTTLEGHNAAVLDVSFSPNGALIASASSDRTIKLWQSDGTLITTLTGSQGSVRTVDFSPDNRWLVSTSADQNALLWDISSMSLQGLQAVGCRHLQDYLEHQSEKLQELCSLAPETNTASF